MRRHDTGGLVTLHKARGMIAALIPYLFPFGTALALASLARDLPAILSTVGALRAELELLNHERI